MKDYRLENDIFVIDDYDKKAPFCSFLPGIAGEKGIPLWSFYVNRGQCMTSFGYNNKNNPIMQFFPANIAYENTAVKGFRTFIRKDGKFFEPFFATAGNGVRRSMYIKQNSLRIVEVDKNNEIETEVEYFILPEEPVGALVRKLTVSNLGGSAEIELLDGMPKLIAYGITGDEFAKMAYLFRSYFTMLNEKNGIPVFLNQISGDDSDEVKLRAGGYFYMAFDKSGIIPPIYDPIAIFGEETSLVYPLSFRDGGLEKVEEYPQIGVNKLLCAFAHKKICLGKGEQHTLTSLIGYTPSCNAINSLAPTFFAEGFIDKKLERANEITDTLTADIQSKTGSPVMDMYARQCYLDNFLRGGYPIVFGDKVIHIYSRKHGDPERDYNYFSIAGEYYSQGDGNFRDVCQNRRSNVVFCPECGDFDIWTFACLMQFDGYNPLFVKGVTFTVKADKKAETEKLIRGSVKGDSAKALEIISGRFTAGELINGVFNSGAELNCSDKELLESLLSMCDQHIEASTDKYGYWSDHWDYIMDLVDSYLKVYPDKLYDLMFSRRDYTYFDSDVFVRPRSEKYYFDGYKVRQLRTYRVMTEKYDKGYIKNGTNWLKDADGNVYKTDLFEKLFSLCVNKFALLDQGGMGIEMEVGKAGWCDSCNGLPSVFGSGMSETFELKRMLRFMIDVCEQFKGTALKIPKELYDFSLTLKANTEDKSLSQFDYWDRQASARELFRDKTKYDLCGKTADISTDEIGKMLCEYLERVDLGIKKALEIGNGLCPTYFRYKATDYDILSKPDYADYPLAAVHKFETDMVPFFLEAPAKHLTNTASKEEALDIFKRVKASGIYDEKLKMYKTSEPLTNETVEIGRLKAFTPGWQEHESVFLHMEYKYLLALLESGLYDEFYGELKNAYIPFLDPKVYGRSILENSSFIASSANPDPTLHGRGFMCRLSGSTAEVVSIWINMFLGEHPFVYENGRLCMRLKPILPGWIFDENGEVEFKLLSKSVVTVHNSKKADSWRSEIDHVTVDGARFDGDTVDGETAISIRNGKPSKIDIYYK